MPFIDLAVVSSVMGAAASGDGVDLTTILSNGVTPALLVVLFLTGMVAPKYVVDDYRKRAEAAEAGLATFNEQMTGRVVPALTDSAHALEMVAPFIQAEIAIRRARDAPGVPRLDV